MIQMHIMMHTIKTEQINLTIQKSIATSKKNIQFVEN